MSNGARVYSLEALKEFEAALLKFAHTVSAAIEEADSEVQRTLLWLNLEQDRYWKNQLRVRNEAYTQAKQVLKRKEYLDKSPLGSNSSYLDERKAIALAKMRFEEAQTKCKNVKLWIMKLEEEAMTFKAAANSLMNLVEMDLPQARAQIDSMVMALERYLEINPPSEVTPNIPDSVNYPFQGQDQDQEAVTRSEPPNSNAKPDEAPAQTEQTPQTNDNNKHNNHNQSI
ncbi:MAG: hypothetical protein JXD22_01655 [Sedimentisphaerales bacterium]|nr:hypothetical protein [Sedimentisphaerales bacterium]